MPNTQNYENTLWQSILNAMNNERDALYSDLMADYSAANQAAFNQRKQEQQKAENDFYTQLYDTNTTLMDTIKRNNAQAIATGASRGAQAATELGALLSAQQQTVDAATELAQDNYDLASEQQAAALEAATQARSDANAYASEVGATAATAAQADAVTPVFQQQMLEGLFSQLTDPKASAVDKAIAAAVLRAQGVDDITISDFITEATAANNNTQKPTTTPQASEFTSSDVRWGFRNTISIPKEWGIKDKGDTITQLSGRVWLKDIQPDSLYYSDLVKYNQAPNGQLFIVDDELYIKTGKTLNKFTTGLNKEVLAKLKNQNKEYYTLRTKK